MNIALILGAATSLLKLHNRSDKIIALRIATNSDITLALPTITIEKNYYEYYDPFVSIYKQHNASELKLPEELVSAMDVLYPKFGDQIQDDAPTNDYEEEGSILKKYVPHYFPDVVINEQLNAHGSYFEDLERNYPDLYKDKDFRHAILALSSGQIDLPPLHKALTLATVDAIAEFGSSFISSFITNEGTQKLVGSILKRIDALNLDEQADQDAYKISKLLVSATINGALDERGLIKTDNKWLSSLLDALVSARGSAEDNYKFVEGLLSGKGYPQLVGSILGESSGLVSEKLHQRYQTATKYFLTSLANRINEREDFKGFLNDVWSDVALAGFETLGTHSEILLGEDNPLLGTVLAAVATQISSDEKYFALSKTNIYDLTATALQVVAQNPDLIDDAGDTGKWLAALADSIAGTLELANVGEVQTIFSKQGLQTLVSQGLKSIAKRPELLDNGNERVTALTQGIITSLASIDESKLTSAQTLASAALRGALKAVENNPALLTSEYPKLVASLAASIGTLVSKKTISKITGTELLATVTQGIAKNPAVFEELQGKLASKVVQAVVQAQEGAAETLVSKGISLSQLTTPILDAMAKYGKNYFGDIGNAFVNTLASVIREGISHADEQLGINATLSDAPAIVGHHVGALVQGGDTQDKRKYFATSMLPKSAIA